MSSSPHFGIVIPVLNRAREIRRAIDSCLVQSFPDFEIIVVDDNSSDGTAAVVSSVADNRVRLLRQGRPGLCPARNQGVRATSAEWVIFLDSDHELLPGGLGRICRETESVSRETGRLGFMFGFDDGRSSPDPLPPAGALDYTAWLRWIDCVRWSDALWVTRRSTFEHCTLPESFAFEFSYHLAFATRFTSLIVPEKVAFQHTDSPNRCTLLRDRPPSDAARRYADAAADWAQVLREHGPALRRWAPHRYQRVRRAYAVSEAMAGKRWRGLRASLAGIREGPLSVLNWLLPGLVLLGPRVLNRAKTLRSHRIERVRYPSDRTAAPAASGRL